VKASLPFSQACENNKDYILAILRRHLESCDRALEIGSGTGQHGTHFAAALPHLTWLSSDLQESLEGLNRRIAACSLPNLPPALELDVTWAEWPVDDISAVFSANTLHIMAASHVELFFRGVARHLPRSGRLLVYGPFKYRGQFTTRSNADFDIWLKNRDPRSGIRDFETVNRYAEQHGMRLLEDNAMPANNQLLVWEMTGIPA